MIACLSLCDIYLQPNLSDDVFCLISEVPTKSTVESCYCWHALVCTFVVGLFILLANAEEGTVGLFILSEVTGFAILVTCLFTVLA